MQINAVLLVIFETFLGNVYWQINAVRLVIFETFLGKGFEFGRIQTNNLFLS